MQTCSLKSRNCVSYGTPLLCVHVSVVHKSYLMLGVINAIYKMLAIARAISKQQMCLLIYKQYDEEDATHTHTKK